MNKPILDKSMAITRGALPGSNKLMVDGVPFREVKLSGGEPPVRLYDTSGPYNHRHREGPCPPPPRMDSRAWRRGRI